jgi:FkbM family methyltransferase
MDTELKWLMTMSRALPRIRGSGRIAEAIQKIYQRKKRPPVVAPVLDFQMRLNPHEMVDGACLFYPQLYDRREVALIRRELREGDVFLDLGANIGFYSLVASSAVGASGKIVSVEADPEMFNILKENIGLNGFKNIEPLCLGISDREETLRLGINMNGNRGSSSFLADDQPNGIQVRCVPINEIIKERGIQKIAAAKVDIEGYGVKALGKFFQEASESLYPRWMIVEEEPGLVPLMVSKGYQELGHWGFNRIFRSKL